MANIKRIWYSNPTDESNPVVEDAGERASMVCYGRWIILGKSSKSDARQSLPGPFRLSSFAGGAGKETQRVNSGNKLMT